MELPKESDVPVAGKKIAKGATNKEKENHKL
jgi:hypothetical protein